MNTKKNLDMVLSSLSFEAKLHGDKIVLLLIGSFAPFHQGHISTMEAAATKLQQEGYEIAAKIFTPNGDTYVVNEKLKDKEWNYNKRIGIICKTLVEERVERSYVDDLSGIGSLKGSITQRAVATVSTVFNISPKQIFVVVGSDQVDSLENILRNSRCICVLRQGSIMNVISQFSHGWFYQAYKSDKCFVTEKQNPLEDISSTEIRLQLKKANHE